MKQEVPGTSTLWMGEPALPLSSLDRSTAADVCVVGAGIAGLSTAYHLARRGHRVAVLEAGAIGSGETGRTTAHLSSVIDDRFQTIERVHGQEGARLCAESHSAAIDQIEATVKGEDIKCDFQRLSGYLFLHDGQTSTLFLEHECDAAQRAGLLDAAFFSDGMDVGFEMGPCVRFPHQAQIHPMKYLNGLVRAAQSLGVQIHPQTRVHDVKGGADAAVRTADGFTVSAKHIVVATNTPMNNRYVLHTKQAAYRSYVIGLTIPVGSIKRALYWDTNEPYHYIRLHQPDDRASTATLIVGGEDHRTGQDDQPADRFNRLEQWSRRRFPMCGEVAWRWSGQIMEPVDGVAFIGRNPMDDGNVYVATGDSGMGMTHGTIASMLITDLIEGRENPWATLYDPSRKTLRSIGEFVRENANTAAQYADWFTGSDVDSIDQIERGCGAVMRKGLTKIAVYRDDQGDYHECSAVCPHLGGIVAWNAAEHSWDCPCHGSRFDTSGRVINGPSLSDLEPTNKLELQQSLAHA